MDQLHLIEALKRKLAEIHVKEYASDLHKITAALDEAKKKITSHAEHQTRSSFHRKREPIGAWQVVVNEIYHLITEINEEEHSLGHEANDKLGFNSIISKRAAVFAKKVDVRIILNEMLVKIFKVMPGLENTMHKNLGLKHHL